MKNRYKIAIIVLVLLFRAPSLFSDEPKPTLWPINQENKVYYYMLSTLAAARGVYEQYIKSALPIEYLEIKGIQVWSPERWAPSQDYIRLGRELGMSEATIKNHVNNLHSRQVGRGVGWGGLIFAIGLSVADYYGYIPKASDQQVKNLPEKPDSQSSNSEKQLQAAH
jgi:hypothetical protein